MLYVRDMVPILFTVAGVSKLLQQSVSKGAQGTAEPHDQEWHIDNEELIVVAARLTAIVFGVFQVLPWRHLACVCLCDVLSQAWIDMTQRHDTGERYTDCGALHF